MWKRFHVKYTLYLLDFNVTSGVELAEYAKGQNNWAGVRHIGFSLINLLGYVLCFVLGLSAFQTAGNAFIPGLSWLTVALTDTKWSVCLQTGSIRRNFTVNRLYHALTEDRPVCSVFQMCVLLSQGSGYLRKVHINTYWYKLTYN
jgi:hypothetical protein